MLKGSRIEFVVNLTLIFSVLNTLSLVVPRVFDDFVVSNL